MLVEKQQIEVVNTEPEPQDAQVVLHRIAERGGVEAAVTLARCFGLEFDPTWHPASAAPTPVPPRFRKINLASEAPPMVWVLSIYRLWSSDLWGWRRASDTVVRQRRLRGATATPRRGRCSPIGIVHSDSTPRCRFHSGSFCRLRAYSTSLIPASIAASR